MKLISLVDNDGRVYNFDDEYYLERNMEIEMKKKRKSSNFSYGNNINKLTCIVGSNGSGKTRLMNCIFKDLGKKKNKSFPYQVFEYNGELICLTQGKKIQNTNKFEEGNELNKFSIIKYSAAIDTDFYYVESELIQRYDISNTSKYFHSTLSRVSRQDMFDQVKFVSNNYNELYIQDKFIKVENKKIKIDLSDKGNAIKVNRDNQLNSKKIKAVPKLFEWIKEATNERKVDKLNKAMILKFIANIFSLDTPQQIGEESAWEKYISKKQLFEPITDKKIEVFLLDYLKTVLNKDSSVTLDDYKKCFKFIREFNQYQYSFDNIEDRKAIEQLLLNINSNDLMIDISSVLMFTWDSISSGEYGMLNLFARLNSIASSRPLLHDDIFLIIDEVDIGLHPEWQRRWASIVPEYLNIVLPDKNVNLILSTHSPIVLSDIPKNNIILKEKENIYENMKEIFGQNIHVLLTDSFFLENTVGEFSKKHIEELLIITTPLHEQLYADVIKQQEDGYSRKSVKDNIEEYCKMHNDRFLKDAGKQTSKCIEDYISNIISIEKRYEKELNDIKENYKKLRDEEQVKEKLKQLKKENEENKINIKEKQQDVLKIEFNKFIEKLNSDLVKIEIFKERATNYLNKNNLINNTGDEIELDMIIDLIERQIKAIGEEFYRGHLLRKLDKLDLQFRLSAKKIEGIEDILKKSSLTEKEKANLMDIIGGGPYDKINTSESK